jgi:hypothetical protein
MGSYSIYLDNKILGHIVGKAAYTMPEAFLAVSTANPTNSGSGLAEPVGNSYARIATAAGDWNTPTSGAISNANAFNFPAATGAWGTIAYFALMDALTAGNVLAYGQCLDASGNVTTKVIGNGDILSIGAGSLVITQV